MAMVMRIAKTAEGGRRAMRNTGGKDHLQRVHHRQQEPEMGWGSDGTGRGARNGGGHQAQSPPATSLLWTMGRHRATRPKLISGNDCWQP